ncbi:MAG: hypothetical protein ACOCX5_01195 [Chloroflexota bacterium]
MESVDLSHLEDTELLSNYRTLSEILGNLASLEESLITDETLDQIKQAYQRVIDELKSRGYSQDEIADMV